MNQSISEDYLDRFSEVAKGLGLSKDIANKLANFIHYEVLSEKKKALTAERKELREKIEEMIMQQKYEEDFPESNTPRSETEEWRRKMYGYNQAINQVLSLLEEK